MNNALVGHAQILCFLKSKLNEHWNSNRYGAAWRLFAISHITIHTSIYTGAHIACWNKSTFDRFWPFISDIGLEFEFEWFGDIERNSPISGRRTKVISANEHPFTRETIKGNYIHFHVFRIIILLVVITSLTNNNLFFFTLVHHQFYM